MSEEEIEKFAAMSADWWNPSGVCAPLHSMNTLRVPFVRDGLLTEQVPSTLPEVTPLAAKPLTGFKLLDAGCGAGLLSEPLARLGATVTAIDPCQQNINAAQAHWTDGGSPGSLRYLCTTVEAHLEEEGAGLYHGVVASEVIEHVERPDLFINYCSQLLEPGGSLFLTTINRTTRSWLVAIIGAEYVTRLLPVGTHSWSKFLSPGELTDLGIKSDIVTRKTTGLCYNPLTNCWALTADHSVNFAWHGIKVDSDE